MAWLRSQWHTIANNLHQQKINGKRKITSIVMNIFSPTLNQLMKETQFFICSCYFPFKSYKGTSSRRLQGWNSSRLICVAIRSSGVLLGVKTCFPYFNEILIAHYSFLSNNIVMPNLYNSKYSRLQTSKNSLLLRWSRCSFSIFVFKTSHSKTDYKKQAAVMLPVVPFIFL